ncbi:lysozyme [Paramicrobacterium humi]|uniref:Lysozyme n=1 Tax=Paramicrobacterium humi TaxID=640635 RepID=A0A1H4MBN6_9MICO|nr:lysozyme [Microbacterium humi]
MPAASVLIVLVVYACLVVTGVLWPNRLFASGYTVRGVDVSSYQGEIDWRVLASEDLDFAYIKATEGSSYVDSRFEENWAGAAASGLKIGAYHFLSFESAGIDQLKHLVDTVPVDGDLPIAVDLEFYGRFFDEHPTTSAVRAILDPLLTGIKEHYGYDAVIYATPEAYDEYVRGAYDENPIWIRSVIGPANLPDERDWTFWQYSNRDRLRGYRGDEPFVDMNVFAGTAAELSGLTRR